MTKQISLHDGSSIPIIGLGTWQLRDRACTSAVQTALEIGYTHLDTADMYGNHAQVRAGIQGFDRDRLYITTKLRAQDIHDPVAQVERFLAELGVEAIDLVLLHWPRSGQPMAEALLKAGALESVRSVGASNFTIRHLKEVMERGLKPVVNQVEFHPYLYQRALLDFCRENGIALVAYSPLARGKVVDDPVLIEIGKSHNTGPGAVTLAWMMAKDIIVIPKASSRCHLQENFEAQEISLSPAEIARIDGLNRDQRLINPGFAEFDR
jgi:diketogulonate reductase-like aldo/keto reductase